MSLGSRLKELRGKRTQEDIAEFLGISRARYSHYENGRSEPDADTLKKLADFYNVTTDYLLCRSSEPTLTEKEDKEVTKEAMELMNLFENLPDEKKNQILSYAKFLGQD